MGRSGCGKSALARLLVGLESPHKGILAGAANRWRKLNRASVKRSATMVGWDLQTASAP
ncbi:ATP-binding cassette domain-containing protein [Escherichia coli]